MISKGEFRLDLLVVLKKNIKNLCLKQNWRARSFVTLQGNKKIKWKSFLKKLLSCKKKWNQLFKYWKHLILKEAKKSVWVKQTLIIGQFKIVWWILQNFCFGCEENKKADFQKNETWFRNQRNWDNKFSQSHVKKMKTNLKNRQIILYF